MICELESVSRFFVILRDDIILIGTKCHLFDSEVPYFFSRVLVSSLLTVLILQLKSCQIKV